MSGRPAPDAAIAAAFYAARRGRGRWAKTGRGRGSGSIRTQLERAGFCYDATGALLRAQDRAPRAEPA